MKRKSYLTTEQKILAVQNSPEVKTAVAMMINLFRDCKLKTHIRYEYGAGDDQFEITFLKTRKITTGKPKE